MATYAVRNPMNTIHLPSRGLALGLASVALFGFGCNPAQLIGQKVAEKVVENAIEKNVKTESGKDVNVDLSGNTLKINGENGEMVSFGENVTIPSELPSDVPVYPGATAKSSSLSKNNTEAALVLSTSDDATKVRDWYKDEAAARGWKQTVSMELEANNFVLGYKMEKDGKDLTLSVNIAPSSDGNTETAIIVARSEQ